MYDVVYFSLATLLSLFSTQLYHGLYTQTKHADSLGCDNLFLDAMLIYSEQLLRIGIGRSSGRSLLAAYDDTISPFLAGAAGGGNISGIL